MDLRRRCGRAMISCDYDPAKVYNMATVKAAKPHTCTECGGVIPKGERHELVKALSEGEWWGGRTCPDCVALRCDITRTYGDGCGWLHGGMREQLDLLEDEKPKDWRRIIAAFNATAVLRGATPHIIKDYNEDAP